VELVALVELGLVELQARSMSLGLSLVELVELVAVSGECKAGKIAFICAFGLENLLAAALVTSLSFELGCPCQSGLAQAWWHDAPAGLPAAAPGQGVRPGEACVPS
jgi:hypothetical protein